MTNQQIPNPYPPRVITTKDLLYLKDALSWELLAMKKFHFYAQQTTNSEIKSAFERAGKMHQQHYEKLLSHLQVNQASNMTNFSNQIQ